MERKIQISLIRINYVHYIIYNVLMITKHLKSNLGQDTVHKFIISMVKESK